MFSCDLDLQPWLLRGGGCLASWGSAFQVAPGTAKETPPLSPWRPPTPLPTRRLASAPESGSPWSLLRSGDQRPHGDARGQQPPQLCSELAEPACLGGPGCGHLEPTRHAIREAGRAGRPAHPPCSLWAQASAAPAMPGLLAAGSTPPAASPDAAL